MAAFFIFRSCIIYQYSGTISKNCRYRLGLEKCSPALDHKVCGTCAPGATVVHIALVHIHKGTFIQTSTALAILHGLRHQNMQKAQKNMRILNFLSALQTITVSQSFSLNKVCFLKTRHISESTLCFFKKAL